jgi:hypothetical protein
MPPTISSPAWCPPPFCVLPARPCELHAPVAEVMSALCCAEAQALTAWRSEERASSPPLVAALHAGCAQLYEQAAKGLRTATGGPVFEEHDGSCVPQLCPGHVLTTQGCA